MVELIELIVGAVLISGAVYVVYREFGGKRGCPCSRSRLPWTRSFHNYRPNYGTIPLPENVESWLQVRNPEPRGSSHTVY
jgi:hypothetical protein